MISIKVNDQQVLDTLNGLISRGKDLRPAFKEIGEDMVDSTKRRFATATGPDGTPWAVNSPLTLERYLGVFKSSYKKDGSLSKRGEARIANKKPLTGETKALQTTINYQITGANGVSVGSPMVYAAIQQFGAKSGEFGFGIYKTRVGSFPIPWGDIPARPFLGVSSSDRENILDILENYLHG